MKEFMESFLFYMMFISPALVGIPLQVIATRKKPVIGGFLAINCIATSVVQFIFVVLYVFYVAYAFPGQAEAVGWIMVAYIILSLVLIGINTAMVFITHFITKWVMNKKLKRAD